MNNKGQGEIVLCVGLSIVAIALWTGLLMSVWHDWHPTEEEIAIQKLDDRCGNKCYPNSHRLINNRCFCGTEYKEAK